LKLWGRNFSIERKKYLKLGNAEIEEAVNEKQKACNIRLQNQTDDAKETYKLKRNATKYITRKAHQDTWDNFMNKVEHDLQGRQITAYNLMRHLNNTVRGTAKTDIIKADQWIKHYKDLWYNANEVHVPDVRTGKETYRALLITGTDPIGKEEVEEAPKTSANRKATGPDGINVEFSSTVMKLLYLDCTCI
jgi:hypothetical protein